MNRLRVFGFAALALILGCQALLLAESPAGVEPRDALVLVTTRSPKGSFLGNGFVIGDGTLVVTAHHLVFEKSKQGQHEMSGWVSITSPYLGDGTEARLVAADKELDLAILRIPWKGHPRLRLADGPGILAVDRIVVTGLLETIRSLGGNGRESLLESIDVHAEGLAVGFVAVRRKVPRFISLSGIGQLSPGWSGSPMLMPGSDIAAGCFTAVETEQGEPTGARGSAANQVRILLEQGGCGQSLTSSDSHLSRPEDAAEAFILLAQAHHHFGNHQYGLARDRIEKFITLRPESSYGYTQSAMIAQHQERFDLAEQCYKKAIKLNPEAVGARFHYAAFLSGRRPDEALEMFQRMWSVDEVKPDVAMMMITILAERGQLQVAHKFLTEALEVNPKNAYLVMGMGACQYELGEVDEAFRNFTRAVELLPEQGFFRGELAHWLEQAGRLDEAEKHFREHLTIEAENPVVHLRLARFLAKHRPDARDEALKEARIALELCRRKGLPKEKIEQLIQELQAETEPAP